MTKNTKSPDWPKKEFSWIENKVKYISIPFTWDLQSVKNDLIQRSFLWDRAIVGGPATQLLPGFFDDLDHVSVGTEMPGILQRINPMATRTTTGCIRKCGFCGVPQIEGQLVELDDWPDLPVICDNNLLAASMDHFNRVIDRLIKWGWADFNQGIDSRLLTIDHAKRIKKIKEPVVRLALDSMAYVDDWEKAYQTLRKAGFTKKSIRSYALIGFNSGPEEAWKRCEYIAAHGIKPLPMWYHSLKATEKNIVTAKQKELGWTDFERKLIMQYYYQRGKRRALILSDYGWRLSHEFKFKEAI